MESCCDPDGYGDIFGRRFSTHLARRYRKRGLDATAARIVDLLGDYGIEGASVLEIGGGIGDLQLELLRRGATRATNLELVGSYEADARRLATEAGLADRVERRQLDIVTTSDGVEPHDVVVMHRVVCCYPDYASMLGAAAEHATRLLVFSHPSHHLVSRVIFGARNLAFRIRRTSFRSYLHDPTAMIAAAGRGPLEVTFVHRGRSWHIVALTAGT